MQTRTPCTGFAYVMGIEQMAANGTALLLHLQVGAKVGIVEAGLLLDITAGRPNVPQILADTLLEASALGPKTSVGVFIGGDVALTASINQSRA